MISVNIIFMFIAAVAFFGFLLNVFFDKLKITNILPLMLIGLAVGPLLNIVNTGPGSTIASLTPFITAVAVAFILFDVGMNINVFKLSRVIVKATKFTFIVAIVTGIALSLLALLIFQWNLIEAFIFGFALAGPSSIIVPTLMRLTKAPTDLGTTLIYEGVASDSLQLVVPILLFGLLVGSGITLQGVAYLVIGVIFGSLLMGIGFAFVMLYLLKKFKEYSKEYMWMLTITMVIAIYGIAQQLNFSGAFTIFIFGIVFSNIGSNRFKRNEINLKDRYGKAKKAVGDFFEKYFSNPDVNYIYDYQREIVFFTSTFFFVYIGMLFSVSELTYFLIAAAVGLTLVVILIRSLFSNMLNEYIPKDAEKSSVMRRIVSFDVARGISPAIVATLPLAYGITIPGFLDMMFLVMLLTNVASTAGVFWAYKNMHRPGQKII